MFLHVILIIIKCVGTYCVSRGGSKIYTNKDKVVWCVCKTFLSFC